VITRVLTVFTLLDEGNVITLGDGYFSDYIGSVFEEYIANGGDVNLTSLKRWRLP
jgi:hypothetical protein